MLLRSAYNMTKFFWSKPILNDYSHWNYEI